jgi:peptide deformylase
MAVREIRMWDDPVLKQKCEPVAAKEIKKIKRDLEDTIRKTDTGAGMAAPQIGISKRVVIVSVPRQGFLLFSNPTILSASEELDAYYEGCLSYPDHYVEIKRPATVMVEWMTRKGKQRRENIGGFAAKVLQHEIDHLDGTCLVGDAWREGRTISGAELREWQELEEAKKKSPVSAMLGAAAVAAMMPPPPQGRASRKSTDILKCSRTACPNPGEGYFHKDLVKSNTDGYRNYCSDCARVINRENNEELIFPKDQFQKVLFESERSARDGDTGKSEEAAV